MLELKNNNSELEVKNTIGKLSFEFDKPFLFKISFDKIQQAFYIPSGCDTLTSHDISIKHLSTKVEKNEGKITIEIGYLTSLWKITYYIEVYTDRFEYFYKIIGKGEIDKIRFFEGLRTEIKKSPLRGFSDKKPLEYSDFSCACKTSFYELFCPEPNNYSKNIFSPHEKSSISVNSDLDYCGGNFVANPSLFCFTITDETKTEWISIGLIVAPNEYHFSEFNFTGNEKFSFHLKCFGLLKVDKEYSTPKIVIAKDSDHEKSLKGYVNLLEKYRLIPISKPLQKYSWWSKPIICGWGHQCYMGDLFRVRSPKERKADQACYFMNTQHNYAAFIDLIDAQEINWGTLIIDGKWYINEGLKLVDTGRWPALKDFVSKLHRRGKKILLWWNPWSPEGFAKEECITYEKPPFQVERNPPGRFAKFGGFSFGQSIAPDITLPSVRKKIKERLHVFLEDSLNGYNIDGFKIDHVAATPAMYDMVFPKGSKKLFGVELLKYYLDFFYSTVKKIKEDALIIGQSPNPYFRNCFDMLRLGDIYTGEIDNVNKEMLYRHAMAKIANPNWVIDMDGWPFPSLEAMRNYVKIQMEYGIPSLYYATHLDTTAEAIPDDIFKIIKEKWQAIASS